jgi:hypothetical protein
MSPSWLGRFDTSIYGAVWELPVVAGCGPPVEIGPGVAPALLLPPVGFALLAELEGCEASGN